MDTIKAGGPADLIAYVWFRMGYRPRNSYVVVGLRGSRQRLGTVVRLDLPPPRHRKAAFARLVTLVRRNGDDGAIVLIDSAATPQELRALAGVVRAQSRAARLTLFDVLALSEDSYRSLICKDERCCPPQGHPLDEVFASAVAAEMVLAGHALVAAEAELVADVAPISQPPMAQPPMAQPPWVAPPDEGAAAGTVDQQRRLDWLIRWHDLLDQPSGRACRPGADDLPDVAWLVTALEDLPFRDALMYTLGPPPAATEGEDDDGADPTARLDDHFPELEAPDPVRLERARRLLSAVARTAPRGRRAEALAVLAWMSWWGGQGARARLLAERALADQPGHRLAGLVMAILAAAVPPPWVHRARAVR